MLNDRLSRQGGFRQGPSVLTGELGHQETHSICTAFAKRLVYPPCLIAEEVLWRDSSKRPNVFRPERYQHRHRTTGEWCPKFIRFAVNLGPPWLYRRRFWAENEKLDTSGPNYKIEITVLPDEAGPLAEWLPSWLIHREKVSTDTLPDPPSGMDGLLLWLPSRGHVHFWSDTADAAYESWKAEQEEIAACR